MIKAGNVTAASGVGTTASNEISAFIISIKITNRVYNDSLEDHQSQSYKILRQDVENVVRCLTLIQQIVRQKVNFLSNHTPNKKL